MKSGQKPDSFRTGPQSPTLSGQDRTPPLRVSELSGCPDITDVPLAPVPQVTSRAPTTGEHFSTQIALERTAQRRERWQIVLGETPRGVEIIAPHDDGRGWSASALDTFGTTSKAFATQILERTSAAVRGQHATSATEQQINAALAFVSGLAPESEIEAMAAATLYVTNDLAMTMLERAKQSDHPENTQIAGNLAAKLIRASTAQMEVLAKLRRGGEQTVRVEHVHVYSGGQAIVGNVPRETGGQSKIRGSIP